jgi:hypothetical protein
VVSILPVSYEKQRVRTSPMYGIPSELMPTSNVFFRSYNVPQTYLENPTKYSCSSERIIEVYPAAF